MNTPLQTPLGASWPATPPWTHDDTEAFLTRFALPTDFRWDRTEKRNGQRIVVPDQPVLPNYTLSKGYGFWLRTTPYFPGLFEEIHDIILRAPDDQEITSEWLAGQLLERRRARGQQQGLGLDEATPTPTS